MRRDASSLAVASAGKRAILKLIHRWTHSINCSIDMIHIFMIHRRREVVDVWVYS